MDPNSDFRNRNWLEKFGRAFQGIGFALRRRSRVFDRGFVLHWMATVMAVFTGFVFKISMNEWCLILLCIAMVLVAELMNSSIEVLSRAVTREHDNQIKLSLDMAAGAVLLASLFSALIAAVIFLPRIYLLIFSDR